VSLFLLYRPRYEYLEIDGYIPKPKELRKVEKKTRSLREELDAQLSKKVVALKRVESVQQRSQIEWEIEELLFMVMYLDD